MSEYYVIVTKKGKEKEMQCLAGECGFDIEEMAVGDGNGANYEPEETQIALKNELWRGKVSICENEEGEDNTGTRYAVCHIPANAGDFTIREVGAFDKEGNLIMIAKAAPTTLRSTETGDVRQISYRIDLSVLNELVLPFIIDPSINTASVAYVEKHFQALNEKGKKEGYAPLNTAGSLPLQHLSDFKKFCVNIGTYDENGNRDLLRLVENASENEDGETVINRTIKTKGAFTYTEASGLTHNVSEILTLNIDEADLIPHVRNKICVYQNEDGNYALCFADVNLKLDNPPYLAYETIRNIAVGDDGEEVVTINEVLSNKVLIGYYTADTAENSGGGG